jgi:hypothetical protein
MQEKCRSIPDFLLKIHCQPRYVLGYFVSIYIYLFSFYYGVQYDVANITDREVAPALILKEGGSVHTTRLMDASNIKKEINTYINVIE